VRGDGRNPIPPSSLVGAPGLPAFRPFERPLEKGFDRFRSFEGTPENGSGPFEAFERGADDFFTPFFRANRPEAPGDVGVRRTEAVPPPAIRRRDAYAPAFAHGFDA
jgi:hypothetical protein